MKISGGHKIAGTLSKVMVVQIWKIFERAKMVL